MALYYVAVLDDSGTDHDDGELGRGESREQRSNVR